MFAELGYNAASTVNAPIHLLLDIVVQNRRDNEAAKKFFRKIKLLDLGDVMASR